MEHNYKKALFAGIITIVVFCLILILSEFSHWNLRGVSNNNVADSLPKGNESKESVTPSNSKENKPELLVVSKPAAEWSKVCKNVAGNYQVKYPDEWSVVVGDEITRAKIASDCNSLKFPRGWINTVVFGPYHIVNKETGYSEGTAAVRIEVSSKEQAKQRDMWVEDEIIRSNPAKNKELIIGGEKALWVGVWVVHHAGLQYEISIQETISEELANQFFSTFKFLE